MDQEEIQVEIAEKLGEVKSSIAKAAADSRRADDEIELVVVTKEKSAFIVKTLAELGVRQIGESYLKEAAFKMDLFEDSPIDWHMVGNIQTSKARQVAARFDVVHSVDRLDLAARLADGADAAGKSLPVFLECNVSGEETKHGWEAWDEKTWDALAGQLDRVFQLGELNFMGLMTMAPYDQDPENARPYFRKLRKLSDFLRTIFPDVLGPGLSMGMSGDFMVAVEEGATHLRIGSRIVGPRR